MSHDGTDVLYEVRDTTAIVSIPHPGATRTECSWLIAKAPIRRN